MGNALANRMTGNTANNILNGGLGIDTLIGGVGNDTYVVTLGDVIRENTGEGTDLVNCAIHWTLAANVENLQLTGMGNINGAGNELANRITGNSGNNILDGKLGIDMQIGGLGNDIYVVYTKNDIVTELVCQGADLIKSSVSYSLVDTDGAAATNGGNVENLSLTGMAVINGTGNTLNNILTGNAAANQLEGMEGNDKLVGGGGNDILIGGRGNDTLTGGLGADKFKFVTTGEGIDVITDFTSGTDKIQLVAANFGLVARAAATLRKGAGLPMASGTAGQFLYSNTTGDLWFDRDGSGATYAAVQLATLSGPKALLASDIQLVAA